MRRGRDGTAENRVIREDIGELAAAIAVSRARLQHEHDRNHAEWIDLGGEGGTE